MDDERDLLRRRLDREKAARKQAEQIAEEKSRTIYVKSRELEKALLAESRLKQEVEMLLKALEAFTAKLDIPEIVQHLHRFLSQVIFFYSLTLYLRTEDHFKAVSIRENTPGGPTLTIRDEAASPENSFPLKGLKSPRVIERKEEAESEERPVLQAETKAMLVLPLAAPENPLGFITVESRLAGAFNEANIRMAQALANEAAVALENALLFQEVKRLSLTDPLTGLNNRRSFDIAAQQNVRLAIRHRRPLSVLMLDIDYFKKVNDTYGHGAGDRVLVQLARVCRESIRSTDLLARFGGEEFCLLFPETGAEAARVLAESLRKAIAAVTLKAEGQTFSITVSIGISECSGEGDSLEDLLKCSDQALYRAKQAGRNCTVIWSRA